MIPNEALSSSGVFSEFLFPRDEVTRSLESRDLGGIALSDPSQGLRVKAWTARYNGNDITVEAEDVAPVAVISPGGDVTEISLTFDQNMQPSIAYFQDDVAYHYWFDTLINDYRTTEYPNALYPRITLDDKRALSTGDSDIILTYVRDGALYYRQQRDRFGDERLLSESVAGVLRRFGMNQGNRLQWEFLASPRDFTIYVRPDPVLRIKPEPSFYVEPEPVIILPVTRRDPCGDC